MRLYLAHYRLPNGARGVLHVIAAHSFDVVDIALDCFKESGIARLSVRPA